MDIIHRRSRCFWKEGKLVGKESFAPALYMIGVDGLNFSKMNRAFAFPPIFAWRIRKSRQFSGEFYHITIHITHHNWGLCLHISSSQGKFYLKIMHRPNNPIWHDADPCARKRIDRSADRHFHPSLLNARRVKDDQISREISSKYISGFIKLLTEIWITLLKK